MPALSNGFGRGILFSLLGFAPSFVVFIVLLVASGAGMQGQTAVRLTFYSFAASFLYLCWWSGVVARQEQDGWDRFRKWFGLMVLMMVCNVILSVAGCTISYHWGLD